jgi:DNA mismatch endonuclease, patch repair protein
VTDFLSRSERSSVMSKVKAKGTAPELVVRSILRRNGFRLRHKNNSLPGKPDIVVAQQSAAIFVHGCFWHGHSCNRGKRPATNTAFWNAKLDANCQRDRRVKRQLREAGWSVAIIWACELANIDKIETKLLAFLNKLDA